MRSKSIFLPWAKPIVDHVGIKRMITESEAVWRVQGVALRQLALFLQILQVAIISLLPVVAVKLMYHAVEDERVGHIQRDFA